MSRGILCGLVFLVVITGAGFVARDRAGNGLEDLPLGVRDGVVVESSGQNGFVHHKDGRLMVFRGDWTVRYSSDGGRTWSAAQAIRVPKKHGQVSSVIRLKSGSLGLFAVYSDDGRHQQNRNFVTNRLNWYVSSDEGKTGRSRCG